MSRRGPRRRATRCRRPALGSRRADLARATTLLAVLLGLLACTPTPADDGERPSSPATAAEDGSDPSSVKDDADGAVAGAVPPLHPAIDGLPATTVVLEHEGDRVEVVARVAADDASRRRGLMEVTDLPDGVGMLFLFEAERQSGFWMWNTRIPLDIAFVGADGDVHTIATMVPCEADDPADCPITAPDEPYVTALEVPAGWFDRVGLGPGATLTWSEPVVPPS